MPDLQLIWAQGTNGVIGREGQIPWHLPEDLDYFRAVTAGHCVIMGRKTWDSLPALVRPLPGRTNIVVTRQGGWAATGATAVHSLDSALVLAEQSVGSVFVIGGGELYRTAMPVARVLHVTEVSLAPPGDAFAPSIDDTWLLEGETRWLSSKGGTRYRTLRYRRLT